MIKVEKEENRNFYWFSHAPLVTSNDNDEATKLINHTWKDVRSSICLLASSDFISLKTLIVSKVTKDRQTLFT